MPTPCGPVPSLRGVYPEESVEQKRKDRAPKGGDSQWQRAGLVAAGLAEGAHEHGLREKGQSAHLSAHWVSVPVMSPDPWGGGGARAGGRITNDFVQFSFNKVELLLKQTAVK